MGKRGLAEMVAESGGTIIVAENFRNTSNHHPAKKAKLEKDAAAAAAKEAEKEAKEAKKAKKEAKNARHASAVRILAEARPDLGKAAIAASGKTDDEKAALQTEWKQKMDILKGDHLKLMELVGELWSIKKTDLDIVIDV